MIDTADYVFAGFMTIIGSACVWLTVIMFHMLPAEAVCLDAGYRTVSIAPTTLEVYCVTRRDQTDIVVPIDEVR